MCIEDCGNSVIESVLTLGYAPLVMIQNLSNGVSHACANVTG